ncbi:MAG TPA: (Fe-S)-binding protein [Thermoanaerobaculia bacterium]|nr:(Fe-S)-binding protein [Thermoanaerobaculia bacterium]
MEGKTPAERPRSVYLFGTCLVDLFAPDAGLAAIELLEREGLRVVFPQAQTCCGQPAFNCGYGVDARAVARAQIALFPEPWPVVVPSGSCAAMMARHYPELFAGEPDHAAAEAFAGRVHELTEFLVNVLGVRYVDRGAPVRVTWHASCHALRDMGVAEEPKALLGQLSNVELVPLSRERECCGFGGTFSVRFPEISAAMVADKAADAEASGAAELLSGDSGCLMNVAGHLEKTGRAMRVRHIAEFLRERIG